MGNKQELETCACLQGYDLTGITETWWDGSYDCSIGIEEHRLFRKDRQGRRGGGVTLCVSDELECMELHLGTDEEPTESYVSGLKGGQGLVTLQQGSATGHPTRKTGQIRSSTDRQEQPHVHKPWSSWGALTTPISVGGTTQQDTSKPGGSRTVLMVTSFFR